MSPAQLEIVQKALKSPSLPLRRVAQELLDANFSPKVPLTGGPTEADKWRHLVIPFVRGNVVELASGGSPVVADCIQVELSKESYLKYNGGQPPRGPVQWRDDNAIFNLPFKDFTVDTLISSHLIEDFLPEQQFTLLKEWTRVLKKGGRLIVCAPDRKRWTAAVAAGQCPNCAHKHELCVGELSGYASRLGLMILCDRLTDAPPGDYNILFVGEKL